MRGIPKNHSWNRKRLLLSTECEGHESHGLYFFSPSHLKHRRLDSFRQFEST